MGEIDNYRARDASSPVLIQIRDIDSYVRITVTRGVTEIVADMTPKQARQIAQSLNLAAPNAEVP
jgi:hypothetical protein